MPTQLLKLNSDQRSLLQITFVRLARSVQPERINMVSRAANYYQLLEQNRVLEPQYQEANVLAEPIGRDSACTVGCLAPEPPHARHPRKAMGEDVMVRVEIEYGHARPLQFKS